MPLDKKSYSDVSKRASSKQRTAWQRSKTAPNPPAHATRPLAPISESSRNKLSAFQFETSQSELDENTPKQPDVATGDPAKEPHGSLAQDEAQDKVNNATTPGPRFSYQDLLGVQAPTKDDDGVSPSERVVWRHDPGHSFSASMSPMIVRKGRKRARSSSPASSPASKATRAAIDVKRLAQALKTPRTDPAMVLWDRYSVLDGTDTTPSGLPNPLLAQLLASSSPRPSREGNASGGARSLRKTISCGSHWPKRRKVDRVDEHGAVSKRGSPRRSTKSSLVSALLETVDDEIRKSESVEAEARHPRSPSPQKRSSLNGRADAKIQARDSPPRPSSRPSSAGGLLERIPRTAPADIEMTNDDKATVAQIDYSSDYGDDDFDEAFQDLDAILPLIQGMARAPVPAHQNVQDLHEPTVVGNSFGDDTFAEFGRTLPTVKGGNQPLLSVEEPVQGVSRPAIAEDEFEDEFGDDLDDEFLMDAVNLVTQVESKHFSQSAPEGQQQYRLPEPNGEGKADLYDDDFGDDDLGEDLDLLVAAVERQATQSAIPPSTSAPHVRTLR
ncbi:hypothetical protein B0H63DRAFT_476056 [Podospora didyma]|uniref:Uncharacterized protein n=1 Tax=Podospora didyma TaxID=330526 RepID=A0AAE0NHG9_9PEZI|nr:hypothetical protein B0H63DRAFT_476056 [Podospora didyma]